MPSTPPGDIVAPRFSRVLAPDEPLHVRLLGELKSRLAHGDWPVGSKIPTESTLASEYGVSRPTVRMSIKLLEAQGLLHTRHGAGTFVTALGGKMGAGLQELHSTTETIRMQGYEPSVECHLIERRPITPECAEAFSLPLDSTIIYFERSIRADGELVAFCYEEIVEGLLDAPFATERFSGSLFTILKQEKGIVPTYAATEIHAVHDAEVGWGEDRPASSLYLLFKQAHFTRAGEPVVYSRNYFVEGAFKFSVMRVS